MSLPEPKLPRPGPRPDPTTDENLAETARIALWNTIGKPELAIEVEADGGVISLTGCLGDEAACRLAEVVVARLPGVRGVVNALETKPAMPRVPTTARRTRKPRLHQFPLQPILAATRYCGFTEASLTAAIRQAVDELDASLRSGGFGPAETLFLIYRNLHEETVTLEIGVPLPDGASATGGLHLGNIPSGPMLRRDAGPGIGALRDASNKLIGTAALPKGMPAPYFWQRFGTAEFRPWTGLPAAPVFLPVPAAARPTQRP